MKIVVQRVTNASVEVDKKIIGQIEKGLMLLVSFTQTDSEKNIDWMVNKVLNLRIFDDESGIMNKSILDISGSILSISQFTLYGDANKGNRPSYINALNGNEAFKLYNQFIREIRRMYV